LSFAFKLLKTVFQPVLGPPAACIPSFVPKLLLVVVVELLEALLKRVKERQKRCENLSEDMVKFESGSLEIAGLAIP